MKGRRRTGACSTGNPGDTDMPPGVARHADGDIGPARDLVSDLVRRRGAEPGALLEECFHLRVE
jgi:hypothetical protein